jgi:hypothetical protein
MKYRTKKAIHSWLKIGLIFSSFALFISPSIGLVKVAGGIAVFCYISMLVARYYMKLPYLRARQEQIDSESEPEFVFEWFTISWVATLLGLAIPTFLYAHQLVSLLSLKRILSGGLIFLAIYSISVLARYLTHRRRQKKLNSKEPEDYFRH